MWYEISCTKIQLPPEPLTRGLPPPDPRSLCPLSSTEFVEPPPPRKKFLSTPLVLRLRQSVMQQGNFTYQQHLLLIPGAAILILGAEICNWYWESVCLCTGFAGKTVFVTWNYLECFSLYCFNFVLFYTRVAILQWLRKRIAILHYSTVACLVLWSISCNFWIVELSLNSHVAENRSVHKYGKHNGY
jgi:hypothetical protein